MNEINIHNKVTDISTHKYQKYANVSGLEFHIPLSLIETRRKRDIRKEMIKGYMKLLSPKNNKE